MHGLRPCLQERVRDVVEERRVRVEVRQRNCLELQTFTLEVVVQEADDGALRKAGVVDRLEVCEHLLRALGCRLVDEGLGVSVRLSQVHCLQQL